MYQKDYALERVEQIYDDWEIKKWGKFNSFWKDDERVRLKMEMGCIYFQEKTGFSKKQFDKR